MERFGVTVERLNGLQHMRIPPNQTYKTSGEAFVEGDASSASYFLAGATITGGTVVVEGCGSASVQGDVRFAEVSAANRGCLRVTAARALLKQVSWDRCRVLMPGKNAWMEEGCALQDGSPVSNVLRRVSTWTNKMGKVLGGKDPLGLGKQQPQLLVAHADV
eukprot:scaffold65354_cov21-Tisochrysis_lutea.AAC.1